MMLTMCAERTAERQLMSVSCPLHILYTQLPLAMCVARQQEGLHQFLSASSNTRWRGTS